MNMFDGSGSVLGAGGRGRTPLTLALSRGERDWLSCFPTPNTRYPVRCPGSIPRIRSRTRVILGTGTPTFWARSTTSAKI